MHLDFMKPDVWNGLVLGVVLIGLALAALRVLSDWTAFQRRRPPSDPQLPPAKHNRDEPDQG